MIDTMYNHLETLKAKLEKGFVNVKSLEPIKKPKRFQTVTTLNHNETGYAVGLTKGKNPFRFVYDLDGNAYKF